MKSHKTLGEIVKHRRQTRGLTQRQLAEMLGVKGSHVAYLESGGRKPSLALLKRLADVLEFGPVATISSRTSRGKVADEQPRRCRSPGGSG